MKLVWQFTTPAYTTLGFSKIIGATEYTIFSFTTSKKRKNQQKRWCFLKQTAVKRIYFC